MNILRSLSVLSLLIGLCWSTYGASIPYLNRQKFLSLRETGKKWGQKPFSVEGFKAGAPKDRAAMAFDLIKGKKLLGKSASEVKSLLGPASGFFWSDYVPAYFIEEGWAEKKDSWQLVFLIGSDDRVREVRVHKNCCE